MHLFRPPSTLLPVLVLALAACADKSSSPAAPESSGQPNEIEYWHYKKGVLFPGAAGTSGCWDGILDSNVVFPAQMPEVIAVTGISYPGGGIPCGIHYGKEVELTAYLDVPTTGQHTADVVGIGGSSNATAIISGIAALVWSRSPQLTRDQVHTRLQQSVGYYPSRHSREGHGLVDALKAVSGS